MAATDRSSRRRFAVACGVLSRCVRAEAEAGQTAAAAGASTMLLMPGADIPPDVREEAEAAPEQAQLTIMYGGRVLVFDDVPADRAAELLRVAVGQDVPGGTKEIPVARKASLQRFMEKRRERLVAQGPYDTASRQSVACKKRQQEGDAGAWLGLGIAGAEDACTDAPSSRSEPASSYFFLSQVSRCTLVRLASH